MSSLAMRTQEPWCYVLTKYEIENPSNAMGDESKAITGSVTEAMDHFYEKIIGQRVDPAERFMELKREWVEQTMFSSSITEIVEHSAYQQIISMGDSALPLIFSELRRDPDHWFVALQKITNENPVKPENKGNMKKMTEDWLRWGGKCGL